MTTQTDLYLSHMYRGANTIEGYLKKAKSHSSISRVVSGYNKRYFVLDMYHKIVYYRPSKDSNLSVSRQIHLDTVSRIYIDDQLSMVENGQVWKYGFVIITGKKAFRLIAASQQMMEQFLFGLSNLISQSTHTPLFNWDMYQASNSSQLISWEQIQQEQSQIAQPQLPPIQDQGIPQQNPEVQENPKIQQQKEASPKVAHNTGEQKQEGNQTPSQQQVQETAKVEKAPQDESPVSNTNQNQHSSPGFKSRRSASMVFQMNKMNSARVENEPKVEVSNIEDEPSREPQQGGMTPSRILTMRRNSSLKAGQRSFRIEATTNQPLALLKAKKVEHSYANPLKSFTQATAEGHGTVRIPDAEVKSRLLGTLGKITGSPVKIKKNEEDEEKEKRETICSPALGFESPEKLGSATSCLKREKENKIDDWNEKTNEKLEDWSLRKNVKEIQQSKQQVKQTNKKVEKDDDDWDKEMFGEDDEVFTKNKSNPGSREKYEEKYVSPNYSGSTSDGLNSKYKEVVFTPTANVHNDWDDDL